MSRISGAGEGTKVMRGLSTYKFGERLLTFRYEWALALLMTLPSVGYYFNYCLKVFGLPGIISQVCYFIQILIAVYSVGALLLKRADIAVLILTFTLACCLVSYFLFDNTRYLFGEGAVTLQTLVLSNVGRLFVYFLPPLLLFFLGVNVESSMRLAAPIAAITISAQLLVFVLTNSTGKYPIADDYMSYAYFAFLPLLALGFSWHRLVVGKVLTAAGWGLVLVSGCRGAMVSAGILAAVYLAIRLVGRKQAKKFWPAAAVAIIIICLLNLETAITFVVNLLSDVGFTSRSLMSLLSGSESFFSGSGREAIYSAAVHKISFIGLGLFGDRSVVGSINAAEFGGASVSVDAYVHNWILELLVDFGIFFGAALVVLVLGICLRGLLAARRSEDPGIALVAAFAASMIIGRYLISASLFVGSEFMLSLIFLLWCTRLDRVEEFKAKEVGGIWPKQDLTASTIYSLHRGFEHG